MPQLWSVSGARSDWRLSVVDVTSFMVEHLNLILKRLQFLFLAFQCE